MYNDAHFSLNGVPKLWGVGEAVIASPANFEKETDMTTTSKQTTLAVIAAAVLSAGMMSLAPTAAQAAGFSAPAPLAAEILGEATNIVKVGGKRRIHRHRRHRHRHFQRGHHWDWGYRPAYFDCFWKMKKRWSPRRGRFIFKKVRICY